MQASRRERPAIAVPRSHFRVPRSHKSSRRSGSVIHLGPPPPRTSSLPSIVITARWSSRDCSSASRVAADTIAKPACSSSRSVASLRAYVTVTPGRTAKKLQAEDHCSRSCSVRSLRSEEHTSELQSRVDLVCRLLLEKKKTRLK